MIESHNRVQLLDLARGVAVLGMLIMNILIFGLPGAAYYNPSVDGSDSGSGFFVFAFSFLFAEGTMRALFSILFGASVCMLGDKLSTGHYIKRSLTLLLIGLLNGYVLLWSGDILYDYAVLGLLLYAFRNTSAKRLLAAGGTVLALMFMVQYPIAADLAAQDPTSTARFSSSLQAHQPTADMIAQQVQDATAPYFELVRNNIPVVLKTQTINFVTGDMWDSLSMMLIGMALYRFGLLSDTRRSRQTTVLAISFSFVIAMLINGYELYMAVQTQYAVYWTTPRFSPSYQLGRLCMALFYLCLLQVWVSSVWLAWLRSRLQLVGRMALSNYLLQSVIGLLLFSGAGLALFNTLSRLELFAIVVACWVFLVFFSTLWLKTFRQGPVEYLWRRVSRN